MRGYVWLFTHFAHIHICINVTCQSKFLIFFSSQQGNNLTQTTSKAKSAEMKTYFCEHIIDAKASSIVRYRYSYIRICGYIRNDMEVKRAGEIEVRQCVIHYIRVENTKIWQDLYAPTHIYNMYIFTQAEIRP